MRFRQGGGRKKRYSEIERCNDRGSEEIEISQSYNARQRGTWDIRQRIKKEWNRKVNTIDRRKKKDIQRSIERDGKNGIVL